MNDSLLPILEHNVNDVRQRIRRAAERVGRDPTKIRLIAVTKYVSSLVAGQLVQLGCHELGENRPQQLWEKATALQDLDVQWHLIGHLQRNKINRTLPLVDWLQSLDSTRLLTDVQRWCEGHQRQVPLLIEVNISGDETKHGFRPAEVADAVRAAAQCPLTEPQGLMTMASRQGGPTQARRDFAALVRLREDLREQSGGQWHLPELSMGMSNDFEVAIEQGATMVRIGSLLLRGIAGTNP